MYNSRNLTYIAAENLTKGDKCYLDDDGKAKKLDLNDATQSRFVGVAATTVAQDEHVTLEVGLNTAEADYDILPGEKVRFSCSGGTAGNVIASASNTAANLIVGVAMEKIEADAEGKVFFY